MLNECPPEFRENMTDYDNLHDENGMSHAPVSSLLDDWTITILLFNVNLQKLLLDSKNKERHLFIYSKGLRINNHLFLIFSQNKIT